MRAGKSLAFIASLFFQLPVPLVAAETKELASPEIQPAQPAFEDETNGPLSISRYIIGPGDVLELRLFDVPELSGEITVLNDGSVSIPLAGVVMMNGLTLQQAAAKTRSILERQLLRPELQLRVIKPRPIRVSVVGAVERPGLYSLTTRETSQTEGNPITTISGLPTLVDAIQKAGGITQQANLRSVRLQLSLIHI